MKILGLVAENYKKLRVVEITPKGRVVTITGRNGQGKTSVLDAIWAALVGSKGIAEKPVRKGAEKAKIRLDLGEFILTRTISTNGAHTLKLENAKGTTVSSPQTVLDSLLGELTFDPLAFVQMKPAQQVETLRQVAKIDLDVDAMNAANAKDYEDRININREVKRLEVEASGITVQEGLPKDKLDEAAAMAKLNNASAENAKAQQAFRAKQELGTELGKARHAVTQNQEQAEYKRAEIEALQRQLKNAEETLGRITGEIATKLTAKVDTAEKTYNEADEGAPVDVAALTAELQQAQLTNREIDKRTRRDGVEKTLGEKRKEVERLTRAMKDRIEQKTQALGNATMPVDGLSFSENEVTFNGIPLEQLGEAEQIRISASIAMVANPQLRILRIMHGESMDEDALKILYDMAEANDFQIWMAKVDSSGKVGIVMEDGMVKAEEETTDAAPIGA
jgi:DNA repair exonuclease SbcCD ATPase subunit